MIAFKTFGQAPDSVRSQYPGIPLSWPWQQQNCTSEQVEYLISFGFTVLTDSAFEAYLADHTVDYQAWLSSLKNIPKSITPRQVRLALIGAGYTLSSIDTFIQSLPEPTKSLAFVWWEYSLEFQRDNELMNQLAPMLGLSQDQLDDIFIIGKSL